MLLLTPLLLLLSGCTTTSSLSASVCVVEVGAATPAAPLPGEAVVLSVSPITTTFDTMVYVDALSASVDSVERTGCDVCDDCRETYGCAACGDCDSCDRLCEQTCTETVGITLPSALLSGERGVQVINAYGSSAVFPLTVAPPTSDTGGADTGGNDSGG